MILSDSRILEEIEKKNIIIEPFDRECVRTNSYDIHLSENLSKYKLEKGFLDCKEKNEVENFIIPESGYILQPNEMYLGSTIEYTETFGYVPWCEGKSSIGRLSISVHQTAGKGDESFSGHWTLEISVIYPVKIYPNMKIGQLIYFNLDGKILNPYNKLSDSKYNNKSLIPQSSQMYKNFLS